MIYFLILYINTVEQSEEEKKPSSMNGRIVLNNPPLPEKQKPQPIIIAPQFIMHKKNPHARMRMQKRYDPLMPPTYYIYYYNIINYLFIECIHQCIENFIKMIKFIIKLIL